MRSWLTWPLVATRRERATSASRFSRDSAEYFAQNQNKHEAKGNGFHLVKGPIPKGFLIPGRTQQRDWQWEQDWGASQCPGRDPRIQKRNYLGAWSLWGSSKVSSVVFHERKNQHSKRGLWRQITSVIVREPF